MHKQLCGDDSVRLSFDSELKLELWSGKLDAGLPVPEDVAEPGVAGAGRHSARWRDHSRARPSGDFDFTLLGKKSLLSHSLSLLPGSNRPWSNWSGSSDANGLTRSLNDRPASSRLYFLEKFQKTCGCSEQGRRWRSARRR